MKLSLLFFIIVVVSSCHSKYQLHEHYLSDAYEKSIDTVVYVPYRKGDKWFYIDRRTKGPYAGHAKAFDEEYDRAYPYNKYYLARIQEEKLGNYIDTTGCKVLIDVDHDKLDYTIDDSIVTFRNQYNLSGGMHLNGDTIIPFKFKFIGPAINNRIILTYPNNTKCLINSNGNVLIDSATYLDVSHIFAYDKDSVITYGAEVNERVKYGLLDKDFNQITKPEYDNKCIFYNERGVVKQNDYYGYVEKDGNLVIQFEYTDARPFYNDIAIVAKDNNYGAIDKDGNIAIPFEFSNLGYQGFINNMSPFKKGGKWGIINQQGNVIIPSVYNYSNAFQYKYGLVAMQTNSGWGMIDSLGNEIVEFRYNTSSFDSPRCVTPNRIVVTTPDKSRGIINRKGKEITPIKYRSIGGGDGEDFFENGLIPVSFKEDGKYRKGYIDIWGKEYFED